MYMPDGPSDDICIVVGSFISSFLFYYYYHADAHQGLDWLMY